MPYADFSAAELGADVRARLLQAHIRRVEPQVFLYKGRSSIPHHIVITQDESLGKLRTSFPVPVALSSFERMRLEVLPETLGRMACSMASAQY